MAERTDAVLSPQPKVGVTTTTTSPRRAPCPGLVCIRRAFRNPARRSYSRPLRKGVHSARLEFVRPRSTEDESCRAIQNRNRLGKSRLSPPGTFGPQGLSQPASAARRCRFRCRDVKRPPATPCLDAHRPLRWSSRTR